jgi:hypothetical protein
VETERVKNERDGVMKEKAKLLQENRNLEADVMS